ncbi:Thioesterase/thiol ester dehydrase-isomerase [Sistotremastrum niveocremeum HHB9708]|uniref:Thioesterase/thiol ester dehydrase-isomerase n=1 Tax=Sistotremastrum niveocremeum HHB9708 TaxID=1314777 RepID=A0A164MHF3_9AGAM|nr:Thioesterase/thiol ester dehydrase-isomerase [Sistotremastrum niveocremeum HHB9708]
MHESYSQIILPFHSSPELLEKYVNASGGIRTGKLMEHLDSLAGSSAYKHLLGPDVNRLGDLGERGFYVVTAAVDRLDMLESLSSPVRDLRISGQVISTGRSSMEVAVKIESLDPEGDSAADGKTVMLGRFSMVCRDAHTHKARPVNPLILSTPEEKQLFAIGEDQKSRKQSHSLRALSKVPPTSEEAQALHDLFLTYGQEGSAEKKSKRVWLSETKLENSLLMFPQERNVHQKIFGGYLMRLAYELGFTTATLFTRHPVRFLSLDGISFKRPVPIGSILRLTSHVAHTESTPEYPTLVNVGVKANVVDVATGSEITTNHFSFTWCTDDGEPLSRIVVPRSYEDAMMWLEGKRALDIGAEIRALRK